MMVAQKSQVALAVAGDIAIMVTGGPSGKRVAA